MISIPVWDGLSNHGHSYDVWLCDIWGVLHNGATAFPLAVAACTQFRARGGRVVLVSNAPRPAAAVAQQLATLGISTTCYDAILTSGDVTRARLQAMAPQRIYLLGPQRHTALLDGLAHRLVGPADAELVLCSGLFEVDANETPQDYAPRLQAMVDRTQRMLCANPDVTADAGGTILYCAGALAALFAQLGGRVEYAGKPHPAIYVAARSKLAALTGRTDLRWLAIGDGVNTDIRGAAREGIDAVYIASRIHLTEPFSAAAVDGLFAPDDFKPTAAMTALIW